MFVVFILIAFFFVTRLLGLNPWWWRKLAVPAAVLVLLGYIAPQLVRGFIGPILTLVRIATGFWLMLRGFGFAHSRSSCRRCDRPVDGRYCGHCGESR